MADPLPYCLALLKRRLRSARELEEGMKRKGFEPEERAEVLARLVENGLIDDLRFARSWVHTRDRLAPRGAPVLRQELYQKGIAKETIDFVIKERAEEAKEEDGDQPDDLELAAKLVAGRQRLYSNLTPEVRKRRLMAFLMRRGFAYDTVRRILEP